MSIYRSPSFFTIREGCESSIRHLPRVRVYKVYAWSMASRFLALPILEREIALRWKFLRCAHTTPGFGSYDREMRM